MKAYCVKCKEKREIQEPVAVFTSSGTPATKGVCPVCGTNMFRMGRTDAHEGMEPPVVDRKSRKKKKKRSGKLVIVESPAKARTVSRYLGKGYTVKASVGHVRDLLRSQLSVDVENDFQPKYRVPNEKRKVVKELKAAVETAEEIYLATDPDREGEAIAWHLMESTETDPEITHRVVFHEITKPAIEEAFAHPRGLNMQRVDAQQARRILDRLVGYSISPILWSKVRGRLSAGRVQSVALRLIVEREREIEDFVPVEYWSIHGEFLPDGHKKKDTFTAKLHRCDGEEPTLNTEDDVKPLLVDMETAKYVTSMVNKGTRKRHPSAPFTTSTMQQDASRRLRFTARKTMRIAQQLYEGVDLPGEGSTGLITYMRTDSIQVSKTAVKEAREYVSKKHGEKFLPEKSPQYKTKTQRAQEAHEAIRPTSVFRTPNSIKSHLTRDQYRLYQLIWKRFIASQMKPAVYDTITVEVSGKTEKHEYIFRATGSQIRFPGFLVVYEESKGESDKEENGDTNVPTDLVEGQLQELVELLPDQHFTQPPARFSDASLVKVMEEYGIGRPSTYAPILSTLQQRGYVTREDRRMVPTEIGFIVNDLVTEHFPDVVDVGFTATMENALDQIASGERKWVEIVRDFYTPFSARVEKAKKDMPEVKAEPEKVGRACPECGNDLIIRWGRHGKFIGCSNFPACRYTEPWLEYIGVKCPDCADGEVVERKTRRGRTFYGCSNYPECEFTSWKRPVSTPCPNCSGTLVIANKKFVQCLNCDEQFEQEEVLSSETLESA